MQIVVSIITRDNLLAVGVKHILGNLFDIEAEIFGSTTELKERESVPDLIITDSATFAADYSFFIPKRNRCAVITDAETDETNFFTINRNADERRIVDRLSTIIKATHQSITSAEELSQREKEVLCLIAQGLINKEIADKLNISINTVLTHRKNISAKLGIKSVSGLSVYAMMNGYI